MLRYRHKSGFKEEKCITKVVYILLIVKSKQMHLRVGRIIPPGIDMSSRKEELVLTGWHEEHSYIILCQQSASQSSPTCKIRAETINISSN
jgi:hypothetical protein